MTTTVNFTPSTVAAFSFQPSLAGTQYSVTVTWNVFGQRYFLNLYDTSGNLLLATALVSSPPSLEASLAWYDNLATVTTSSPHGIPVGSLADVVVAGTGTSFDGTWEVLATGPVSLTYSLTTSPVAAPGLYVPLTAPTPVAGSVGLYTNLVAPVLDAPAWLLYFADVQQFQYA